MAITLAQLTMKKDELEKAVRQLEANIYATNGALTLVNEQVAQLEAEEEAAKREKPVAVE